MLKKFKLEIGGRDLIVKIDDLAEQSNGSVFLQYGDTLLLSTAVMSKEEKEGLTFFPLTVDYEEKFYAAGKIGGSRYIRREARPSVEAICNARLIDRAIRPRFPKDLKREVQVIATVLAWDNENEPDILGLISSSLALSVSDIPWHGPVAAIRIGRSKDKFIINPTYEQRKECKVDVVFAAVEQGKNILINMIEGNFREIDEKIAIEAYQFAKPHLKKIIDFEKKIFKEIGKEKVSVTPPSDKSKLENEIKDLLKGKIDKALYQKDKQKRSEDLRILKKNLEVFIEEGYPDEMHFAEKILEKEIDRLVHEKVLENDQRIDGRKLNEIRKLDCDIGTIPRTHGSGIFCRGQTKALSILTLGAPGDVQLVEGMEIVGKKRFMHHYNFPPYSVGEVRRLRGPGRREIGHGTLAERAVSPIIPTSEEFPYTIRIVSEIMSSNGSSSMASVCGCSLALMDAGVPIKAPVAGIALGLIADNKGDYKILTDIQGPEDHYGDMDFKVAGTKKGITVIQMDVKFDGITEKIFEQALEEGKKARLYILKKIEETIAKPRADISPFAPRILTINIDPEKIRKVIGPGGKMINEIIDKCGVTVDVEDTGEIFITAEKEEGAKKALQWIKDLTREVKVGEIFEGKVKRILDFGAFVEILPDQEGMIHISKLAPYRVKKVEDIVKIGDIVSVTVIGIDNLGRIDLSLNNKNQKDGRKQFKTKRKK